MSKTNVCCKKGAVLLELLIVVSITLIASVTFFTVNSEKIIFRDVDEATARIVSELRSLQNESLNGKQLGGVGVCLFKLGSNSESSFFVSYYDCQSPENLIQEFSEVRFDDITISISALGAVIFSAPGAIVNGATDVSVISNKNPQIGNVISIRPDGNIIITKK